MAGRRVALLVATYDYQDGRLSKLVAPPRDADDLANVLRDPQIAGFDVTTLINKPLHVVGEAIGEFYRDQRRDDLSVLYFTGHGLKDDYGRLYLAMANTRLDNLQFTGLSGNQISDAMRECRARQKVLILDCCYSGAFPADSPAKGDTAVNTLERFAARGRAVLTASDATQYSFEGASVSGEGSQSVFTKFLVEGLVTGQADLDSDGDIALDELYGYAYERVIEHQPQQRPKKQEDVEGRIVIARNVHWTLPSHVLNAVSSPLVEQRLGAVGVLRHLHRSGNEHVRVRVLEQVRVLAEDDSRSVSAAARAFLSEVGEPAGQQSDEEPSHNPPFEPGGSEQGVVTGAGRERVPSAEGASVSYESGRAAEAAGNWAAAIEAYTAALADPQHAAAASKQLRVCRIKLRNVGLAEQMRGHAEEGQWQGVLGLSAEIARFDRAAADPDGLASRARAQLASQGQPSQPGEADTAEVDILMATALAGRGQTHKTAGRYEKALADLTRAIEVAPGLTWAIADRGKTYQLMGRHEEALADLTRAIDLNPHLTSAIADRGETYRAMGRYEEALADLNRAIEIDPGYYWAIGTRGWTYQLMGRYKEALADLNRAIEINPGYAWGIAERGEIYRLMVRYEEALADLTRGNDLDPGMTWPIRCRGAAYRAMGRYDEAVTDLNRAIEINPGNAWAIGQRGQTYRQMGRYDEAVTDLNRAIEINPGYAFAIAERGQTHLLMKRRQEAVADLTRAIEINPGYAFAIAERGQAYRLMGRYEESLADLNRAIEVNPGYAFAIAQRGETYRQMGSYDEAVTDLNRAIEIDPGYYWAIRFRGQTYRQMGRYDEAVADLTRAIEINPGYASAIAQRGEAYRQIGRHDEAIADLTRAIEMDPGVAWVIASRGRAYRAAGRYDEAIADLTRAFALDPSKNDVRAEWEDLRQQLRQRHRPES